MKEPWAVLIPGLSANRSMMAIWGMVMPSDQYFAYTGALPKSNR
jgi:hypothetical protein